MDEPSMKQPNPDPKITPQNQPKLKDPQLEAVLPDSLPFSSGELLGTLDEVQKKIDSEWETAKNDYHERIDNLMESFVKENFSAPEEKSASPGVSAPKASML